MIPLENILLNDTIEELENERVRCSRAAKSLDVLGDKTNAAHWYAKEEIFAKAVRALEKLIPKKKESYIL